MTREELRAKLDLGDYGEEIDSYASTRYISSSSIAEIFDEIADSNTSIYYSDIAQYIGTHIDEVNEAIEEFGWEGCGSDLYKAGQMAEYSTIQRDLEDHIDDIIVYAALVSKYESNIPEDVFESVYDNVSDIDWNDRLESAIEDALSMLDDEEDEDEEEEDE